MIRFRGSAISFISAEKKGVAHWFKSGVGIVLIAFAVFFFLDLCFPFTVRIDYSRQVLSRDKELLHAFLSSDQKWRMNCSLEEVNPILVKTIIQKEDQWFWYHPGVNIFSIGRAVWQNFSRGERISGASTITMQVVRLLERRERTYLSKVIEIFRAVQLEMHYSKSRILEMYLNLLPYGGNIEGIKAASFLYFGQKPYTLSTAQVVTLAIIPNNPHHLRLGINNERILKERNHWLVRLSGQGWINESQLTASLTEPLTAHRLPAPRLVPHYAEKLVRMFPEHLILNTFIDRNLQDQVEKLMATEIASLRMKGITNCAVIVISNTTSQVLAYAGSAGFKESLYSGQVDGVSSLRSPGSALKPFLYAMAIDKGLITPKSMLEDVPINFGGYKPSNYDETYRGQLTATQALALSLNIPAVDLANRLGVELFVEKLGRGGLRWISKRKDKLGLSVVLGGCGVTLEELTNLYSSLAREGRHFPLQYCKEDKQIRTDTLFSPQSSWMITEMLTNLKRPDLPNYFENSVHLPHIAWKTGTSYGRRDAWSIGYNPEYSVGVWVGNFDGTGIADLSGSETAAPILFKIFNQLTYKKNPKWFKQPEGVDFRLVCSESGLPPNDFCENIVMDYYIPAVSSNRKCNHMLEVFTNPSGTESYCRSCLPASGYRSDFYPNYRPQLLTFYNLERIPYKRIPPHNSSCNRVYQDQDPVITSLNGNKEYILYADADQKLQLACSAGVDVTKVYWYINNKFLQDASVSETLFFTPVAGMNKISCCDDKGRNTDIYVKVTFI